MLRKPGGFPQGSLVSFNPSLRYPPPSCDRVGERVCVCVRCSIIMSKFVFVNIVALAKLIQEFVGGASEENNEGRCVCLAVEFKSQ